MNASVATSLCPPLTNNTPYNYMDSLPFTMEHLVRDLHKTIL